VNWDELFEWKHKHPGEALHTCARFDEQVHLTRFVNRTWVETYCGLQGPARDHALVFRLPRESVECAECLRLAGLKKEVTGGLQQGVGTPVR
jgi:hypothetical protein